MKNKWFAVCLISAFVAGIVLSTLVSILFPRQIVEETVYNEKQILSQMISIFDALPNDNYPSFTILYYPRRRLESKPDFRVNLDYGLIEYRQRFDNFDDFISFISDPEKYNNRVLNISK